MKKEKAMKMENKFSTFSYKLCANDTFCKRAWLASHTYILYGKKGNERDMKSIFGHIHTTNLLVHAIDFHYMGYCSPRGYSMVS